MQVEELENVGTEANIWLEKGIEFISEFGPKVIGAILIWIIGSWIIKRIMKVITKVMDKRDYDKTLQSFLSNLLGGILLSLLF